MNLVIDNGNTRTKFAIFDNDNIVQSGLCNNLSELPSQYQIKNAIISNVGKPIDIQDITQKSIKIYTLSATTPLPWKIKYKTPQTLGTDRIADIAGATKFFPKQNCLVIDAGTCITLDFIDKNNNYLGGNILPGLSMKFKALHTFTAKLPLLKTENIFNTPDLIGETTEQSITSGVLFGTLSELEGFVNMYKKHFANLRIIITGGDSIFLTKHLSFEHLLCSDLNIIGLNEILKYNEEQNI